MTQSRGKIIRLTSKQRFDLWSALKAADGEMAAERPTFRLVAEQMTRQLGFTVTADHIRAANREGVMSWVPRRAELRRMAKAKEEQWDLDTLADLLEDLAVRLNHVEERVQRLIDRVAAFHDLEKP